MASIVLIDENTTHADLALIGDDTELDTTARYTDVTYGIGWGEPNDDWIYNNLIIVDNIAVAESMSITYSGNYIDYFGSLRITDQLDNELMILIDQHTNNASGQSLTVNGVSVFSLEMTNVENRTDIINLDGVTSISIGMKGSLDYGYVKRFIRNLILNIPPVQANANISVSATATAHAVETEPKGTANISVSAIANVTRYTSTATIEVSATATAVQYVPIATANISVSATAFCTPIYAESSTFTFVQSIRLTEVESTFRFIQSIAQPSTSTIITRVSI